MSSNKPCEFNNYINIILLIMFVLVVAVSIGIKCFRISCQYKDADVQPHQQANDSIKSQVIITQNDI